MEGGLTKQKIISELTRSPHGALKEYLPIVTVAAKEDAEFLAHLIAWNEKKGAVRDAKVALPICNLHAAPLAHTENALAHLALLDPRNFVRALRFGMDVKLPGSGKALRRLVERYLRAREANLGWWLRGVMQHRASFKTLYALYHVKPSPLCDRILFKGYRPAGSALEAVALLNQKDMSATGAAALVIQHRIPFLSAVAALGGEKAKSEDFVLALITQMSPTELVTNSKLLEKLGVRDRPVLRAAYDEALARAASSKKAPTLKTSKAAAAVTDEKLKAKLVGAQEKQIAAQAVEGNWLVLGDKSGSMQYAIEASRLVAATLAKFVKGEVHLVFFDTEPRHVDVTGKTYDQIVAQTAHVLAGGGTSIGCGVRYAMEKGWQVDGIAVVSDGAENTPPMFAQQYRALCERQGNEPPVYLYLLSGESNVLTRSLANANVDAQTFDLRGGSVDMYSLPNLVTTMRASRYSLVDEIMETRLLTLDEVFRTTNQEEAA